MAVLSRGPLSAAFLALLTSCGNGTSPEVGPSVSEIVIIPEHPFGNPAVLAGETLQLRASVWDSAGTPIINPRVTWFSADAARATVSSTGLVSGIMPGFVKISARAGTQADTLEVIVLERAASLAPVPTRIGIVPGGQTDVITGFRDAAGNPLDPFGRTVDWASSNPAIASFSYGDITPGTPRGLVSGVAPGSATITVTGPDASGSIPVDVSLLTFTSLATGVRTTCGLTTGGVAYCWGANIHNWLANPLVSGSATPLRVEADVNFTTISPGAGQTCAIAAAGTTHCWGDNSFGQLGNGSTTLDGVSTPTVVAGGHQFAALSSGENFVCALTIAGKPYCWGAGEDGQLGTGTTASSSIPVAVAGDLTLTSISANRGSTSDFFSRHVCGVAGDGSAHCWGSNDRGQLGDNSTTNRLAPTAVAGALSFNSISAGVLHTCGIAGTQAYCWGDNSYGQLGSASTGTLVPAAVSGGIAFASVSAGFTHSCGLTSQGAAYCWGANEVGQLGDGSNTSSTTPVPVSGGLTFASVSAGNRITCGLTTGQVAYCWGGADLEEPGTGVHGSKVPLKVIGQP